MDTEEGSTEKPFRTGPGIDAPEMQETDTEEGSTEKPLSEQDQNRCDGSAGNGHRRQNRANFANAS